MAIITSKIMMGFEPKRIQKKYGNIRTTETIGGKTYNFRSKAEVKLASCYFEILKIGGQIKDWEYESHKFVFADSSWLVDFTIRNNDDTFEYYEYKGYVEEDTRRKLKLLNKYWPKAQVTMVLGSKKQMKRLGSRATNFCKRVCLLSELTKGLI